MKEHLVRSKTMVKLVWSLAVIVIIIGLVRVVMLYEATHNTDQHLIQRQPTP